MNNIKLKTMLFILAICVLASQAFAITVSFGGGSESGGSIVTSNTMSMGAMDSLGSLQTLSIQPGSTSLSGTMTGTLSSGSWANQYHQADSGPYHVATYAYMDQPDSFTYSFTPSTTSSSASISESLTATNARNLTYGGFAYNSKDYAAVQLIGEADAISYSNSLYAGSTKVSAQQSFSGFGCNLTAISWAERGNLANEYKDHTAFDILNTTGEGFQVGPNMLNATYDLFTAQMAQFANADVKSYSSTASIASNTASSSQSADVPSADYVQFQGTAAKGIFQGAGVSGILEIQPDSGLLPLTYSSDTHAYVQNGRNLTYASKATSTSTTQSTSQALKATSADYIEVGNDAGYEKTSEDPNAIISNGYGAYQHAVTYNPELGKNGIQSSASISGAKATSSLSADISSADYGYFGGEASVDKHAYNSTNYVQERTFAQTSADFQYQPKGLTYSATNNVNKAKTVLGSSASATQTLKAKSNVSAYLWTIAEYYKDDYSLNSEVSSFIGAAQQSSLYNAALGKGGLQSSSSFTGGKASASQKSDITSLDRGYFWGGAAHGVSAQNGSNSTSEGSQADTSAEIYLGKGIKQSSDSASTITSTSASQDLSVKSAGGIYRYADAYKRKYSYDGMGYSELYQAAESGAYARGGYGSSAPVLATMSGKDSAFVDASGAKVTQSLKATGIEIGRRISASKVLNNDTGNWRMFFAEATTDIGNEIPASNIGNSLSGQATATLIFDTSASVKGSWSAKIAKELGSYTPNFRRLASARNMEGDNAHIEINKTTIARAKSVIFTESASATEEDATAT